MRQPSYEYMGILSGGTNVLFLLRERDSSTLWAAKIFRNSKSFLPGHADLNQRALLASRLAVEVCTCAPEMRLVDFSEIGFTPDFDHMLDDVHDVIIQDRLLIVRHSGITLHNYLKIAPISSIANLDDVIRNFVFNLWFGNYDKKADDYIVDNELICRSVDYSLSGPGFVPDDHLSIGAYFQTYDYSRVWDTGWAIADPLLAVIRERQYSPEFFLPMIERIEGLSEDTIRAAFEGLAFFRYATRERIDSVWIRFLLERQAGLREAVARWCAEDYPKGTRIPEE